MPYARPAPSISTLQGEVTDAQHGARTGPAGAHAFADLAGAPALAVAEAALVSNTPAGNAAFAIVLSLSLTPGTWLVTATATGDGGLDAEIWEALLSDGTGSKASTVTTQYGLGGRVTMSVSALIVFAVTTNVELQVRSAGAGRGVVATTPATAVKATHIRAVKVAP